MKQETIQYLNTQKAEALRSNDIHTIELINAIFFHENMIDEILKFKMPKGGNRCKEYCEVGAFCDKGIEIRKGENNGN